MGNEAASREKLIALLQLAYSGELAAAYAYRGHWHSVSAPDERAAIRKIEAERANQQPETSYKQRRAARSARIARRGF